MNYLAVDPMNFISGSTTGQQQNRKLEFILDQANIPQKVAKEFVSADKSKKGKK